MERQKYEEVSPEKKNVQEDTYFEITKLEQWIEYI